MKNKLIPKAQNGMKDLHKPKYNVYSANYGIETLDDNIFEKGGTETITTGDGVYEKMYFDKRTQTYKPLPLQEVTIRPDDAPERSPHDINTIREAYRNIILGLRNEGYNNWADAVEHVNQYGGGVGNAVAWYLGSLARRDDLLKAQQHANVVSEKAPYKPLAKAIGFGLLGAGAGGALMTGGGLALGGTSTTGTAVSSLPAYTPYALTTAEKIGNFVVPIGLSMAAGEGFNDLTRAISGKTLAQEIGSYFPESIRPYAEFAGEFLNPGYALGGAGAKMLEKGINGAINLTNKAIYSSNPISLYLRYGIGKFKYGFDAKIPDLIRRTSKPMPKTNIHRYNSDVFVSPLDNRFRFQSTGEPSPVITNFSTDLPVISNNGGTWVGLDINIIKGRNLLGKNVISTRPQDTFTYGDKIRVPKKDIITISSKHGTVPEELLMTEFLKVYKRPTYKDYQFMDYVFQPKYRSEVIPNTPITFDNIDHPLFKYMFDADMRSRINQPWDKVMYDIAPTVESEFRNDLGIVLRSLLQRK